MKYYVKEVMTKDASPVEHACIRVKLMEEDPGKDDNLGVFDLLLTTEESSLGEKEVYKTLTFNEDCASYVIGLKYCSKYIGKEPYNELNKVKAQVHQ